MTGGKKNLDGVMVAKATPPETKVPEKTALKDTVLISWESFSFEKKAKDYKWYVIAAVIILAAIGYLIWQQDWFTIGIVVIVSGVLFWYVKTTKPEKITYKLTPLGLYANDRLYPYSEIHSFWIVYNEKVQSLYLAFTKKYLPSLVINLGNTDPITLKNILLRRIPEQEKRTENTIDKIVRLIGI
jgi:hypothetical protein